MRRKGNSAEHTLIGALAIAFLLVWLVVANQAAKEPTQAMIPCGHAAGLCLSSLYPIPPNPLTPDTPEAAQRASVAAASTQVQVQQ